MSTISTGTTTTTAYSVDADTTGALVIKTGATPTTAVTVSAAQVVTLANALPVASGGTGLTTATGVLVGSGSTVSAVAAGASGNILTSNGTTWTSAAAAPSGATGVPVLNVYTNTAPGQVWTKPATVKAIKVTVVGGGAPGVAATSPNRTGSGGGGGGTAIKVYPAPSLPGPQPYTVGAASSTSSFGVAPVTVISATGGSTASPGLAPATSSVAGGAGGTGSNGDFNSNGTAGGVAFALSTGPTGVELYVSGMGGSSSLSVGAAEVRFAGGPGNTAGVAGQYGAGGSGGAGGTTTGPGGAGGAGVVIVEEFY